MKNITELVVALLAIATLSFAGCGGTPFDIAPVSGKVTSKGGPVAGLRLVFTPMPNEANTDPGPWSTGVTNAQGEFSLETRQKEAGAAVGKHTVSFEYEEGGAERLDELDEDLETAVDEGDKAAAEAIKKEIADIEKKAKTRPRFSEEFTLEFTVPPGGTTEANFDFE